MEWNEDFIPSLGQGAEITQIVTDIAEQVANTARSTAPVDTGDYRAGITVEVSGTGFRTVARVMATDPASMLVESFSGNLARALGSARG